MNADDARKRGLNKGAEIRIVSRRGEIRSPGGDASPQPNAERVIFVPWFDQPVDQQGAA
jgi:nitrate reductase NapA